MLQNVFYRLKQGTLRLRRRTFELFGSARHSRPARDDLDRKLEAYLPPKGVFVEVGGFDGFTGSNTYYLERIKGWSGVLVEPSPWDYQNCVRLRSRSKVYNCALVSLDHAGTSVELVYAGDLSFVSGAYVESMVEDRLSLIRRYREPVAIQVPARTLTSVLEEAGVGEVDFFSLDVEGFEAEVLRGLDLSRYAPKVILIECQTESSKASVVGLLSTDYRLEAKLSRHDYLFLRN